MSNIKIIGITGFCRSGKDTVFSLLNQQYPKQFKRYAFADNLKYDMMDFIDDQFNIDIFKCSAEDKELIRPLLISFGCAKRKVDINYWVKSVDRDIGNFISNNLTKDITPVITDFRFESEIKYFKDKYGDSFKLLEVVRLDANHAIPQEELLEMPKVRPYVDHKIEWNTVGDSELKSLLPFAENFYNTWIK
jgi:hypothetical protein